MFDAKIKKKEENSGINLKTDHHFLIKIYNSNLQQCDFKCMRDKR